MNRIDRLNALLIHLQGKTNIPIEELEDRFDVSRRTIFRDIRSLIDAGVPIGGDAGDGYFIVPGYHLPPVVFNKEEASALLMGAKFIEQAADSHTYETFQKAMYKVKAVLKYSDKEFLERLDEKIAIRPGKRSITIPDSHIAEIQTAIATTRLISITYYSHYQDTTTKREVEPLGMVFYSSRWHLIGFCRLRQDLRDFRADRIQKVKILQEVICPEKHPNYLDFLNESLTGTDAKEVIIQCSRLMVKLMGDQKYYMGFAEEKELEDGSYQMKFVTPHYTYFARWILMFGKEVVIESPSELLGLVTTFSQELLDHHGSSFSSL